MPHAHANGIDLFYESFGDVSAPTILLVMGLGTQGIAWPDAFVERLVAGGYRVVRFDNRDIGRSTHLDGAPAISLIRAAIAARLGWRFPVAYTLSDMADDAVGLLDALGIAAAHWVGASMGGMIAQLAAARAPDRVRSLVSIMSSSGARGLPGPTAPVRRMMMRRRDPDLTRAEAVALGVEVQTAIAWPDPARPSDAFAELAGRSYDAGFNPAGSRRQLLAILRDGDRSARLARITAPTLVIHGEADPLVPIAHADDLVRRIPGARLERIAAMAHDLPPSQLAHIAALILTHIADVERVSPAAAAA